MDIVPIWCAVMTDIAHHRRKFSRTVRIATMPVPVAFQSMAVFVMRRIEQGAWNFGVPVTVVFISTFLMLPGIVILLALVRRVVLFLIGLLLLCGSSLLGLVAASSSNDGQAGLNLFLTPIFAVPAPLILGWMDLKTRSSRTND